MEPAGAGAGAGAGAESAAGAPEREEAVATQVGGAPRTASACCSKGGALKSAAERVISSIFPHSEWFLFCSLVKMYDGLVTQMKKYTISIAQYDFCFALP